MNKLACHVGNGNMGGGGSDLMVLVEARQESGREYEGVPACGGQLGNLNFLVAPAHHFNGDALMQGGIARIGNAYANHSKAAVFLFLQ